VNFLERHPEIEYREVLDWIANHEGRDGLVMIYGKSEDSTPLLRLGGIFGALEALDEGQVTSDHIVGVASFTVGDARFGLNVAEFESAAKVESQDWVLIDFAGMTMELRFGPESQASESRPPQ
jgi:hypothetical protein